MLFDEFADLGNVSTGSSLYDEFDLPLILIIIFFFVHLLKLLADFRS